MLQQASFSSRTIPSIGADIEELKKQQVAYEEQVRDPEGTINNPAVTDDFKARVATVQKLLFQGDAYFRTGQFDKAEDTYSKILILDPYNKAAREKMAHIERYRIRAAGFRHEEYERQGHGKSQPWLGGSDFARHRGGPRVPGVDRPHRSNRADIQRKLLSIIIDKVNFDKLDIATVIQFLQQKSKELDPDHRASILFLRLTADTASAGRGRRAGGCAGARGSWPPARLPPPIPRRHSDSPRSQHHADRRAALRRARLYHPADQSPVLGGGLRGLPASFDR